ncbi:MAG: HNH endonuclease [Proteobacteria bacterium]|nr:HNH endonuclease [Pseudomonadota bacterium]
MTKTISLHVGSQPQELVKKLKGLSDKELESRLKQLASIEHTALSILLAHLQEFDTRKLYADRGQPSLFAYCVGVLGYSEHAAYKRIRAARAARVFPVLLQRLSDGEISLAAICVLSPHLRAENIDALLASSRAKPMRELEAEMAALAPKPDSPDCLRALPSRAPNEVLAPIGSGPKIRPGAPAAAPGSNGNAASAEASLGTTVDGRAESLRPLSTNRHLFRFTGSSKLRADYERARGLVSAPRRARGMEAVFEEAIDALLDRIDPARRTARREARASRQDAAPTDRTLKERGGPAAGRRASRGRHIPSAVRDAVWVRDGGRCKFIGPDEARCPETRGLQVDHIKPFARGGRSDDASNLRLMCPAHNLLLARRTFGPIADRRVAQSAGRGKQGPPRGQYSPRG